MSFTEQVVYVDQYLSDNVLLFWLIVLGLAAILALLYTYAKRRKYSFKKEEEKEIIGTTLEELERLKGLYRQARQEYKRIIEFENYLRTKILLLEETLKVYVKEDDKKSEFFPVMEAKK